MTDPDPVLLYIWCAMDPIMDPINIPQMFAYCYIPYMDPMCMDPAGPAVASEVFKKAN